jgi:hypothetical protein
MNRKGHLLLQPILMTALGWAWLGPAASLSAQDSLFPYATPMQGSADEDRPPLEPPRLFPFAVGSPNPAPSGPSGLLGPAASADPSWLEGLPDGRGERKAKGQAGGDWGTLSAQTVVRDSAAPTWDDPLFKREWKTDQTWKRSVLGPFYLFGQLGANGDEVAAREVKVAGKTGLACKLPLVAGGEVTLRGGPSVSYADPVKTDRLKDRSEMLVEVQARWPLLARIGLEYQGTACPALSPLDRDWFDQDLRLAFPLGTAGKFKLGAKRHWENVPDPRPLADSVQLYLGLELTH